MFLESLTWSESKIDVNRKGINIASREILLNTHVKGIMAKRMDAVTAIAVPYRRSAILNKRKVSITARIPIKILGTKCSSWIDDKVVSGFNTPGYPTRPRAPAKNS